PFILCLDATGDRTKGKTTDYAASQVHRQRRQPGQRRGLGQRRRRARHRHLPARLADLQAAGRLKPGDVFTSKPPLAVELLQELAAHGLHVSVVLADSMYGERWEFTTALARLGLSYGVAIRANHIVWTFPGERVRQTRWRPCARVFTDGTSEQRYRCE